MEIRAKYRFTAACRGFKVTPRGRQLKIIKAVCVNMLQGQIKMLVLGIETSCDETGVAVYDSDRGS